MYAIYVDVREKPKILFYIIAYKLFYGYMINTIRILSQLEQYLKYPMKWEIIKRTSAKIRNIANASEKILEIKLPIAKIAEKY